MYKETHWSEGLFNTDIQQVIEGWDDPNLSYEFDLMDIVKQDDEWYLVGTAGCSCPTYEDNAYIAYGPFTDFDAAIAWLEAEYASDWYTEKRQVVVAALRKAQHGEDIPSPS